MNDDNAGADVYVIASSPVYYLYANIMSTSVSLRHQTESKNWRPKLYVVREGRCPGQHWGKRHVRTASANCTIRLPDTSACFKDQATYAFPVYLAVCLSVRLSRVCAVLLNGQTTVVLNRCAGVPLGTPLCRLTGGRPALQRLAHSNRFVVVYVVTEGRCRVGRRSGGYTSICM